MTFKTNAILAAALMAAFGANAGTVTPAVAGGTVFAAEAFQGATANDANTAITPGAITYSVATTGGIVVNAGGSIYYYLRLSNGKFTGAPATTAISGTVASLLDTNGALDAGVFDSVTVVGISADKTTALVKLTNMTAGTVNIGVGGTITYTPAAGAIDTVKTALATAGGTVSATGSLSALAAASAPDATVAQPSDVDGAPATAVIAKSVQAITGAVSNLPSNTVKINLSATPPASAYTPTAYAQLGSVTFTEVTAKNPDAAANLTIAAANAGGNATVVATPGTGQSFPVGAILKVGTAVCADLSFPSSTKTFTALDASAAASLTVPVDSIASNTPLYLCLSAPGAGQTATPITANITAELLNNVAVPTAGKTTTAGAGYALGYNGTQIDVTNYVPAAVSGWTQFIRVANSGALSAPISAAFVDETTGTVGTSAVIIPSLSAGAVKNLTAADIEAALGTQAETARPRLRITAPSNSLTVQNMLFTPNSSFTNNSAQQQ